MPNVEKIHAIIYACEAYGDSKKIDQVTNALNSYLDDSKERNSPEFALLSIFKDKKLEETDIFNLKELVKFVENCNLLITDLIEEKTEKLKEIEKLKSIDIPYLESLEKKPGSMLNDISTLKIQLNKFKRSTLEAKHTTEQPLEELLIKIIINVEIRGKIRKNLRTYLDAIKLNYKNKIQSTEAILQDHLFTSKESDRELKKEILRPFSIKKYNALQTLKEIKSELRDINYEKEQLEKELNVFNIECKNYEDLIYKLNILKAEINSAKNSAALEKVFTLARSSQLNFGELSYKDIINKTQPSTFGLLLKFDSTKKTLLEELEKKIDSLKLSKTIKDEAYEQCKNNFNELTEQYNKISKKYKNAEEDYDISKSLYDEADKNVDATFKGETYTYEELLKLYYNCASKLREFSLESKKIVEEKAGTQEILRKYNETLTAQLNILHLKPGKKLDALAQKGKSVSSSDEKQINELILGYIYLQQLKLLIENTSIEYSSIEKLKQASLTTQNSLLKLSAFKGTFYNRYANKEKIKFELTHFIEDLTKITTSR